MDTEIVELESKISTQKRLNWEIFSHRSSYINTTMILFPPGLGYKDSDNLSNAYVKQDITNEQDFLIKDVLDEVGTMVDTASKTQNRNGLKMAIQRYDKLMFPQ